MPADIAPTHGLRFEGSAFYVIHRRREFGPFDYHWSSDLRSVDLTYQRTKFGEVFSAAQMCVDLRDFHLPRRVVQVAVLVTGAILQSLHLGDDAATRERRIAAVLRDFGCRRFAECARFPRSCAAATAGMAERPQSTPSSGGRRRRANRVADRPLNLL